MDRGYASAGTNFSYRAEPRQRLASGPSRSSQSNIITQANAAPRTERPLTEIVGVGLRELYAKVLTEPMPDEFAPLIERLPRRSTGVWPRPWGSRSL
jgi:Anti-sigma factor NepR